VTILDAIAGLKGHGRIKEVFGFMGDAEREIAAARAAHPDADLSAVFMALCPPPGFTDLAPEVYRAHARELIARTVAGQDLALGTDAECLVAFMEAATRAPLNALGASCADRLFVSVFGRRADDRQPPVEPWAGACEEELQRVRKRLAHSRLPAAPKMG
jgi:hypothetical protein